MVRRVFEPEEFERSAAAGDPRLEPDFAGDTDAWRSHQDQWFTTFTGEALPPVGDQNRAKRWKASKRQRKAIEEARLKDAISKDRYNQARREKRHVDGQEKAALSRTDEAQNQRALELLVRAHDASGSCISANSLAWHLSRPDEELQEAIREKDRRLDEQQQAFAEVLVDAGVQ